MGRYYISAFSLTGMSSTSVWLLNILGTLSMIAAPYVYRVYPVKNPGFSYNLLQWIGYLFFGIYSVLIVLTIFISGSLFLYSHLGQITDEKRIFIKFVLASISLIATGIITSVGFYEARKKPVIKNIIVPINRLPEEFHGVRILQISDLHVGQTIKREFVEKIVQMSIDIKPDMVVLTGDMIDGLREQIGHELISFKKIVAPLGNFMVPGNHEYYWGVNNWLNFWSEIGFVPLINEHTIVRKNDQSIVIAGVHDYSAKRINSKNLSSPNAALKNAPDDLIKILLAHQPRSIYEAARAGFDLQLSGHTHSGQYFPYNLLVHFFQPFVKGLHLHEKTWIYVNQGTGYWGPPSRFGVPPEMTVIELRQGPVV
jgi:predicted MPP superfamily phosphohydrolase